MATRDETCRTWATLVATRAAIAQQVDVALQAAADVRVSPLDHGATRAPEGGQGAARVSPRGDGGEGVTPRGDRGEGGVGSLAAPPGHRAPRHFFTLSGFVVTPLPPATPRLAAPRGLVR
jgi:hypothetical protein